MIASEELLDAAFAAYEASRLEEAEELCRRALSGDPQNPEAIYMLGVIAGATGRREEGIALLREAVALDPGSAEAFADLGHLLHAEGRGEEAATVLQRALHLDPDSVAAWNSLGEVELAGGRAAQAAACFEQAIARDPARALLHYNLAVARQDEERNDEAIAAYRHALALAPDLAEACLRLGNLLLDTGDYGGALALLATADSDLGRQCAAVFDLKEGRVLAAGDELRHTITGVTSLAALNILGGALSRLGRFADAIACYERGLALVPENAYCFAGLTLNRKMTAADRPLIARMAARTTERRLTDHERTSLHFALGKAHDDLGDYKQAVRYFDEGNRVEAARLRKIGRVHDEAAFARGIAAMTATVTPQFFARHAGIGSDSELPILIVGMPRSGTTLTEQILSSHPEVAAGDELTFWTRAELVDTIPDPPTAAFARRVAKEYLALLRRFSPSATRVTDKMPTNFLSLGLAHLVFPRARIIHCRRHPIDTCLSVYFTNFGKLPDFAFDRDKLAAYYRQYRRLMAHWRRVLPPACFFELDYEELVADREGVTRRLVAFCGLEWSDECLRHEDNARPLRTASIWQARQPIYRSSVERWRRYEPWLGAFAGLPEASVDG